MILILKLECSAGSFDKPVSCKLMSLRNQVATQSINKKDPITMNTASV